MQNIRNGFGNRKKILVIFLGCTVILLFLFMRLVYLMIWRSDYYAQKAIDLHERERGIKAARGQIVDCNGVIIADNKAVCTISVIHNQIENPEEVIKVLSKELEISEETVRKRVEKYSSIERIKSNVSKETGDVIRGYDLPGVKVDEDYKRYYPYGDLASKVLGFTGGDNQGIIGLEVVYEEYLMGTPGTILTMTDARGVEVEEAGERRIEPVDGSTLHLSLDVNIQSYAQQLAEQAMLSKSAQSVSVIVMNPQNGEIMAMVNVPEFDLNAPYELTLEGEETAGITAEQKQNLLNQKWRNGCINDTYEPGSTFKIITAAAGLEAGVVKKETNFSCPGYIIVDDRKIRCHKTGGHGGQDFVHATMTSCNPAFVSLGLNLGVERFYDYFQRFGLLKKTGVDLPGEAATIMHKKDKIGPVELATISFGQSFQITPIQLITTAASIVNGGKRITPHLGVKVTDKEGAILETFSYQAEEGIVSSQTSETMRYMLEMVVAEGGGKNGQVEGVRMGGKTATSQTLPRSDRQYISSFLGFAPADDPQVMAIAIINRPQGTYYGGQIAAPIVRQLFENILPYLGIMDYNEMNEMSEER